MDYYRKYIWYENKKLVLEIKLTSFMMHNKQKKIQVNKLFIALLDKLFIKNSYDKYEFNEHKIKGVTLKYSQACLGASLLYLYVFKWHICL